MKIRGNVVGTTLRPDKALVKATNLTEEEKAQARANIGAAAYGEGGGGGSITVDSELSATSTNPVQNKVITSVLAQAEATLGQLAASIPNDDHINALIDAKLGVIENAAY